MRRSLPAIALLVLAACGGIQGPIQSVPAASVSPALTRKGIEWERLLGVRAAAIAGGVALAITGFFFVQYSIEPILTQDRLRVRHQAVRFLEGGGVAVSAPRPLPQCGSLPGE